MRRRALFVIWVALAAVGALLALFAGTNLALALPAAALAIAAAAAGGATALIERVQFPERPAPTVASDSLVPLTEAFRSGTIGRQSVLAAIRSLEREMLGAGAPFLTFEREQELLRAKDEEFRAWANERMGALEAAT